MTQAFFSEGRIRKLLFVGLLVELPVLLTELVDATCSVHELGLPCVERVALVAHFHFHEGIFVAVLPLNGFFGLSSRFAQKSVLVAHVLEYHQAVVVGVDAFFHGCKIRSANVSNAFQFALITSIKVGDPPKLHFLTFYFSKNRPKDLPAWFCRCIFELLK